MVRRTLALALLAFLFVALPALAGRTVYITKTGAKYHLGSCRYLKKSKIPIDIDDAVARGYTPCSVCSPGNPDQTKPKEKPKDEPKEEKQEAPKFIPFQLSRIVDGDTIEVEIQGKTEKIRYIGIDTPEMTGPEPWAEEAKAFNAKLLKDRKLYIEFDVQERDKYGRLLGYVYAKDDDSEFMVNAQLIRYGYAVLMTIPPNVKYVERFKSAQKKAQEEKLNLWSE